MRIKSVAENNLIQDASSVWVLEDHRHFGYSDGAASEKYLEGVLRRAKDLSSRSSELEACIRDWPSEYHLTTKRSQLLSGFSFDRSLRVLEVGCGCGAITRQLGETFDEVVSVEGSINRARLARLRTRDLQNVSVICAPFHEIRFARAFDIIFCVGVYEYSASFVNSPDPYDAALGYFCRMLTPSGIVVVAIENQFGLKYFSSSREDHLGVMFEGLEGYRAHAGSVRTFGKAELEDNLKRYFQTIRFYYPYPDYKLPDCVIAEEFLASGHAGELVSQMRSRDYAGQKEPLFDESVVLLELARNRALPFFSNSFLVLAGRNDLKGVAFEQSAVIFSTQRREKFGTKTRIVKRADNQMVVSKRPWSGAGVVDDGNLKLVSTDSIWINAHSLQTMVYLRCKSSTAELSVIFEPCREWVGLLEGFSTSDDGVRYVGGEHVDSIWPNVYPESGTYKIVDREWIWGSRIRLNVVVIRAIYNFVSKLEGARGLSERLGVRSGLSLISSIAKEIGVDLERADFDSFVELEAELQSAVFGLEKKRHRVFLRWFLFDRPSLDVFRRIKKLVFEVVSLVRTAILRLA